MEKNTWRNLKEFEEEEQKFMKAESLIIQYKQRTKFKDILSLMAF